MIDLQIHTADSDGTWAWDTVLEYCLSLKLKAFAITDHDTVVRHGQIRAWAREKNAMAIPGIELSTQENGHTVHLLGYFLEKPLEKLEKRLTYLREERRTRNGKIIQKLQALGVSITEEQVLVTAGRATVGRPHIARTMMQNGHVKSLQEAFDRYLSASGSAYFPKEEIPLKEGIELLHEAGAVTSVAHPGLLKVSLDDLEQALFKWSSWGLDGIEAIYPSYSEAQTAFFHRMSIKYDLIRTGGSDFHGENKPAIKIAVGLGNMHVPDDLLAPLLKKRDEILK